MGRRAGPLARLPRVGAGCWAHRMPAHRWLGGGGAPAHPPAAPPVRTTVSHIAIAPRTCAWPTGARGQAGENLRPAALLLPRVLVYSFCGTVLVARHTFFFCYFGRQQAANLTRFPTGHSPLAQRPHAGKLPQPEFCSWKVLGVVNKDKGICCKASCGECGGVRHARDSPESRTQSAPAALGLDCVSPGAAC